MMNKTIISNIPTIWIEPENTVQKKIVIWLPGFSGTKEAMEPQLRDLAKAGFIGLSFDPHQHGERQIESLDELRARVVGNIRRYFWPILAQTAEEVPTIIDWAMAELGVDSAVGMGGISMGGDISVAAAGVDQRICAVTACIATPDWMRPGSFEPPGEPDDGAQACYDRRNPLTHLELYAHNPAISFQCGADDQQVPPDGAQRFMAALQKQYGADRPVDVTLHANVPHSFTPAMWANCVDWFTHTMHDAQTAPTVH
ncbi:MAG: alpha/beta fold hydrolase [Chloroflexota bacterium]